EREASGELAVETVRLAVRWPPVRLAGGVDVEQLVRHGEHRLPRLRLQPLPRGAAQLVERGDGTVRAHVALDQVDPIDGKVEAIASLILEMEVVALGIRHLHVTEPTILADAVVGVDDVVVRLEFGEAREPVGGPGGQAAANLTALSEELRLGDE